RQIDSREIENAVIDVMKLVVVIRLTASGVRTRSAIERPLVDVFELIDRQRVLRRIEVIQIAEQPARGIAELAIRFRGARDELRTEWNVVAVVDHRDPQA